MATKTFDFAGRIKWAKVYEPDEFRGAVRWTLNFYPDDLLEFKKSGIQTRAKKDEDGEYYPVKRDTQKLMKGELVLFTPPTILDEDGRPVVRYVNAKTGKPVDTFKKEDDIEITREGDRIIFGNLSKVRLKVDVYDTSMGKGHRLKSIRIVDLIEYIPPDSEGEEVEDDVEEEETPPVKSTKTATKPAVTTSKELPW